MLVLGIMEKQGDQVVVVQQMEVPQEQGHLGRGMQAVQ
tara:strand:+ start:202 stop:315 length:114 start_codon:yes stop_codon:yes gene_type:complete